MIQLRHSGPITGIALSALNKFLLYGLIRADAPRAAEAVNQVALAATRCRFESSCDDDDDATLVSLLELLRNCLRSHAGRLLYDTSVWAVVQCLYTIATVERASQLLRRHAHSTLGHVVLHLFSLSSTMVEDGSDTVDLGDDGESATTAAGAGAGSASATETITTAASPINTGIAGMSIGDGVEGDSRRPFGSAVLARVLAWLAALTSPSSNTGSVRKLALKLINMALEIGGVALGQSPPVVHVLQDDVCRNLVRSAKSGE